MEIISKESIKPSSSTPDHLRTFQFSLLDQLFPANFPYFSHILYYSHDNTTTINVKQPEISAHLKRSLSDALALYYPLAGRMKGESSVDCNDEGVDVFEARVDAYLPDIIKSAKVEELAKFVPRTSPERGSALLGIQLNYFNCGGIAIGMALCHRIGDACTLAMFVKAWATMARGKSGDTNMVPNSKQDQESGTDGVSPSFVASTLFPYKEELRYEVPMTSESPENWGHTRRICFSSSKIASLRATAKASSVAQAVELEPTRVEVVTAAIWKWLMARKGRGRSGSLTATQAVNVRRRMEVPLPDSVFGNLIQVVEASGEREMELGELVVKMREAIGKLDSKFLKALQGENGCDVVLRDIKKVEEYSDLDRGVGCVHFTSWCKFPFQDSDFGWGKPVWMSVAGHGFPNSVMLMDSMSDIGGIEAWISMVEDYDYDDL